MAIQSVGQRSLRNKKQKILQQILLMNNILQQSEAANPAQQAAIAISMKKKGIKPKDMKEMVSYREFTKKSREAAQKVKQDKQKKREMASASAYKDKKGAGIRFYDKKGAGRIKAGKKIYD